MIRRYWRLRAAWARWRTRRDPRPSIDELLSPYVGSAKDEVAWQLNRPDPLLEAAEATEDGGG